MRKIKLNGITYKFPSGNNRHMIITTPENGIEVSLWLGDVLTLYDENNGNEILIKYLNDKIIVFNNEMLIIKRRIDNANE